MVAAAVVLIDAVAVVSVVVVVVVGVGFASPNSCTQWSVGLPMGKTTRANSFKSTR